jgi:hypothetical protein
MKFHIFPSEIERLTEFIGEIIIQLRNRKLSNLIEDNSFILNFLKGYYPLNFVESVKSNFW